jgi:hypothetical protein
MKKRISGRAVAAAIAVFVLLPSMALAEVSVKLDRQGNLKRVFYLTQGNGHSARVWGQVRPHMPLELMLNPLGDVHGDLPPTIALHPETGHPWVVWSMNIGNQKRIAFSKWECERWTAPGRVVTTPDPFGWDQMEPILAFDGEGLPYLVWWVDGQVDEIYFSTMSDSCWTPPYLVSDDSQDSRHPSLSFDGSRVRIIYETPSGERTWSKDGTTLIEDAIDLMDSPLPPGNADDGPATGGCDCEETPFVR